MKKNRRTALLIWLVLLCVLLAASLAVGGLPKGESIRSAMRDAVLHEENKISLLGLLDVNPAVISGFTVTGVLLVFALLVRLFFVPRMKTVPGKFQLLLESAVGYFDGLAKEGSPHRNRFLGGYVFAAGAYIFIGTLFELFGVQAVTTRGLSVALPAPLSDINAAISLGCLSYLVILSGGIEGNASTSDPIWSLGSLPISMSFRLFGALLSGLLVTELVYYYIHLSFVLPVAVGVMFTLLHALIQTYVLTMLTTLFYGEVSEPHPKKAKKSKSKTKKAAA